MTSRKPKAGKGARGAKPAAVAVRELRFSERLILVPWLLDLLGEGGFAALKQRLSDPSLEHMDDDGRTRYHKELVQRTVEQPGLPGSLLFRYDQNIVAHWRRLVANRRDDSLRLKYFQYLSLLFTEIYLDRYFRDPEGLCRELNGRIERYNGNKGSDDRLPPYVPADLNKIAFWMATGSGKTLLMHVHIQQYRHYLKLHRRERELNRIILLTPNEGLSRQHLEEFTRSGIPAELFEDQPNRYLSLDQQPVEIIEVTRLSDAKGPRSVPVEAFEGNNLVLVDEGHRGASASEEGAWMQRRNALCETGFSFEYSATFGQAVSGSRTLRDDYSRCILFDYSYRHFYEDGYGKDYRILNLAKERFDDNRKTYLTAALLTYYEQLLLFTKKGRSAEFIPFNLERPLWVFVGSSVTKSQSANTRDITDVEDILLFLDEFVRNARGGSVKRLEKLLSANTGLLDEHGNELFGTGRFSFLHRQKHDAETLFHKILKLVFNADAPGAIHIDILGKAAGEIGLRIGEYRHFGVINIGEASKLVSRLSEKGMTAGEKHLGESLFSRLNSSDELNILIGAKKFTEGWNSFRVASLGLMHVGASEGSQIIQLFGRGVRLKGLGTSLKRSSMLPGVKRPDDLPILETLNVFGIRSDYMEKFREILQEEGVPSGGEQHTIEIETKKIKFPAGLQIPSVGDYDFKDKEHGERPVLGSISGEFGASPVILDWYPEIQERASRETGRPRESGEKKEGKLGRFQRLFLDYDRLYFDLIDFKNERNWFNLNISRDTVQELMENGEWYRLYIPPDALELDKPEKTALWNEVALVLLQKYCAQFYKDRRQKAEDPHREFADIGKDGQFEKNNIYDRHVFTLLNPEPALVQKLSAMKDEIEAGNLSPSGWGPVTPVDFDRHLYRPLFYVKNGDGGENPIRVNPLPLNDGERMFVEDLRAYCTSKPPVLQGRELYLLRNQSRGRGLGFCEAEGFHPDFLMWILDDGKQYLTFVDPKGLRHIQGDADPKLNFHRKVKEIEAKIRLRQKDASVVMNSFIVSVTSPEQLKLSTAGKLWPKQEYLKRNILFPMVDRDTYIGTMVKTVLEA